MNEAPASGDAFLQQAHAMEVEAAERYDDFAAQMELHGNLEVAELFRTLAGFERAHADTMAADLAGRGMAPAPDAPFVGPHGEGIETGSTDALHYLMTPYQALEVALGSEERALAFFADLAERAETDEVRRLAGELADEERRHVELVRAWLARVPKPDTDWAYDPDEPRMPD